MDLIINLEDLSIDESEYNKYLSNINKLEYIRDYAKRYRYTDELKQKIHTSSIIQNIDIHNQLLLIKGTEDLVKTTSKLIWSFILDIVKWIKNVAKKIFANIKVFVGMFPELPNKLKQMLKQLNEFQDIKETPELKEKYKEEQVVDLEMHSNLCYTFVQMYEKKIMPLNPRDASLAKTTKESSSDEVMQDSHYMNLFKSEMNKIKNSGRTNLNIFSTYTKKEVFKLGQNIINTANALYTSKADIDDYQEELLRIESMSEKELNKFINMRDRWKLQIYKIKIMIYNSGMTLCQKELTEFQKAFNFIAKNQEKKESEEQK